MHNVPPTGRSLEKLAYPKATPLEAPVVSDSEDNTFFQIGNSIVPWL